MFETYGNKKGIIDLVTKKWDKNPQVQRDEMPAFEEMPIEHYRPQVDDDAEVYTPKSEG